MSTTQNTPSTDLDLVLKAQTKRISGNSSRAVRILIEKNGNGAKKTEGTHLLVAAGRAPNTQGIGLEFARVEPTNRGYIKVNERLETTAPGVWALGEVAGSPQFTDVSVDDFRVVHDSLTGGKRVTTGRQVPFCLMHRPDARVAKKNRKTKRRITYDQCKRLDEASHKCSFDGSHRLSSVVRSIAGD